MNKDVTAFLQGPVYEAQSGQVVGILKNMRDTFNENLASATATEAAQQTAHDKLIQTLQDEKAEMESMLAEKNTQLGQNDTELADSRTTKKNDEDVLAADQEFLATMTADCKTKTAE